MPVMPTRSPIKSPASESCQFIEPGVGGSGHETNGCPVRRQPSLYASHPVQKP